MCELVQVGIITHEALKEHLYPYRYAPENITSGLWIHQDTDTNFTLEVDKFGIKYRNKKYVYHLIGALREKYEVNQYWTGGLYCGITLNGTI